MDGVQFIPATEQDADELVELRRRVWLTTYRGIYPDAMLDEFDSAWHRTKELQRIRNPQYAVYFIAQDGCHIGYLTLHRAERITLQSLYLLKEHRHRGIGRQAFAFVNQFCTDNEQASFVCHCVPENHNARAFYEKMGGRIIGEDRENEERWMNSVTYRFDL